MTVTPKANGSVNDVSLDPVVEEVREQGRLLTQRFNNDPRELFKALYRLADQHPKKMVGQIRVVAMTEAIQKS